MHITPDSSPREQDYKIPGAYPPDSPQELTYKSSFAFPPDTSWPAAAELEYLTRTVFLAVQDQPLPAWMDAHIATNFNSQIDVMNSRSWAEHVRNLQNQARTRPASHRITSMNTDVDITKAHADVFCHMEAISIPANIRRLGMAQLKWKRHPFDGRWQLVQIIGMREPSDLIGDMSGAPKMF